MTIFAQEAVAKGYQVLSFDLPEHGDRKNEDYICNVQNCMYDLKIMMYYAQSLASNISVFACSMGAYFSLLTYSPIPLKQCLFLSPVVNMERIITNMWNKPTAILYGLNDDLCEFDVIAAFVNKFECELQVMESGEHYFHTDTQLQFFRHWAREHIISNIVEFDSEFSNVKYIKEDNIVLLTWKKYCCFEDYRNPTTFALELLKRYPHSNFVVDAKNGFEDAKEDVEWGISVLLPEMSKTDCKYVVFILNEVNEIEDEMDMWTKEFMKYFVVKKVESYLDAVNLISK